MKRGIWLILFLIAPLAVFANEACQNKCVDNTFYQGNFDSRAEVCNYLTIKCENGCNEQGCLTPGTTGRITTPQTGITRTISSGQTEQKRYTIPTVNTRTITRVPSQPITKEIYTPSLPKYRTVKENYETNKKNQCETSNDCYNDTSTNLCLGKPYCDNGACKYLPNTAPKCEKVFVCEQNTCNPKTGLCETKPEPDGTKVEAWNPNDCYKSYCKDGKVAYEFKYGEKIGDDICQCAEQTDCAKYEDGDFCNGTLYCEKSTGKCKINPATTVVCSTDENTQCRQKTCVPETGKCEFESFTGKICKGNHACYDSICSEEGFCVNLKWNYEKEVPGQACQCSKNEECLKYENGNLCDGTLFCNKANTTCTLNPATILYCQSVDDTSCRKNTCNPLTGACEMKSLNEGNTCYDSKCYTGICTQGNCPIGWNNKCQCAQDADCAKYEDGNLCNGTLYCDKYEGICKVNPATIKECSNDADDQCKKNTCNTKTGKCEMIPINEGNTCYDSKCYTGICTQGNCPIGWNNKCQCAQDTDCLKFDDGNLCNGIMYCDKYEGVCKPNPATEKKCTSWMDTECQKNTCNPLSGTCEMKNVC